MSLPGTSLAKHQGCSDRQGPSGGAGWLERWVVNKEAYHLLSQVERDKGVYRWGLLDKVTVAENKVRKYKRM